MPSSSSPVFDAEQEVSPTSRKMLPSGSVSSSNAQLRKIKKPLIERRRRERINDCLYQLKKLVLEAMNKDESRYSKMEKADILEMTVQHLRSVQQRALRGLSVDVTDISGAANRYVTGYNECAREVAAFLSGVPGSPAAALESENLLRHLSCHLQRRTSPAAELESPSSHVSFSSLSVSDGETRLPPQLHDRFVFAYPVNDGAAMRSVSLSSSAQRSLPSPASSDQWSDSSECGSGGRGRDDHHEGPIDLKCRAVASPEVVAPLAAGCASGRTRCDSGVYSGANSPTQADEVPGNSAVYAGFSPVFRMSPSHTLGGGISYIECRPSVAVVSDVWRPW